MSAERRRAPREPLKPQGATLPLPKETAYFSPGTEATGAKAPSWILERTDGGNNLVAVIAYGSTADGTQAPDSIEDYIIIVKDAEQFVRDNLKREKNGGHREDFGIPRLRRLHTALTKHAPSYHYTQYSTEDDQPRKVKYGVLSLEDFVSGGSGTLGKTTEPDGAFGHYIAGRMQKTPIKQVFWPDDPEQKAAIEKAINKARIDGLWLALGTTSQHFSLNEITEQYVSLSYRVDGARKKIENPRKVQDMIEKNKEAYEEMMRDLLAQFVEAGIVSYDPENQRGEILHRPQDAAFAERLEELNIYNTFRAGKNGLDAGIMRGLIYADAKRRRTNNKAKEAALKSK